MKRFLWLCFALSLLASCSAGPGSSGAAQRDGSGTPTAGASGLPSGQTASPINKERSVPKIPPPPVSKRAPDCVENYAQRVRDDLPEDKSWVVAFIDPERTFGPQCDIMRPGSKCEVPFEGAWKLVGSPSGSMVFQVFEDDEKSPVRSPEVGPVKSGGRFSKSTRLFYTVGENAKKATFRVLLKDIAGRVVAQSEAQTVTLPACFTAEASPEPSPS